MTDRIWEFLCAGVELFSVMFALNVVLLVMLLFTYPSLEPGTASYYVGLSSFVVIGVSLVGTVFVIRKCRAQ